MKNPIDAAEQLLHLLFIIQNKLMRPVFQQTKTELSPLQIHVLMTLRDNKTVTMTMLANEIRISKQQLTRLVDNLVSQGSVQREFDNLDRRIIKISLTTAGLDILVNIDKTAQEVLTARLEAFDDKKLTELNDAVGRLSRLLRELS